MSNFNNPPNERGLVMPRGLGDETDDVANWTAFDQMLQGTHAKQNLPSFNASGQFSPAAVAALQAAVGGAGVTWLSESSVVVGIEGPNGEQFALFERQPDGSVQMQIVPRTGTLNSLLGLSGSAGEIASPSDVPALFKFTGVANTGSAFWPNGVKMVNITGTGAVAMNATQRAPDCDTLYVTKDAGVTSITSFGQLTNGYRTGQTVKVVNATGISCSIPYSTGTPVDGALIGTGKYVTLRWTGAAWVLQDFGQFATGVLALCIAGAYEASGDQSFSAGAGSKATALGATAIGTGSESHSDYGLALNGGIVQAGAIGGLALNYLGLVTAENGVAIRGEAAGYNSVTLNGPKTIWNSELGLIRAWGGSGYKCDTSDAALTRATASTSAAQLTVDGAAPSASNTLGGTWTGVRAFEIEVVGHLIGAAGVVAMKRRGAIYKNGTTAQILGSVQTIGTDITAGSVGTATLAITAGSTYNDLKVEITPGVSTSMVWGARVHLTSVVA